MRNKFAANVLCSFIFCLTVLPSPSHAGVDSDHVMTFSTAEDYESYHSIAEIHIVQTDHRLSAAQLAASGVVVEMPTENSNADATANWGGTITDLLADLSNVKKWIALGQKLWELVKANQPVAHVKTNSITVVPQALGNWTEMETWKGPSAKSYTVSATNLYGMTVISHTYTVAFNYGGSIRGRGKFLANATIIPTAIDVAWGFTLNSDVEVGNPVNTGTSANPIPGVDLTLKWSMDSVLKHIEGRDQFFVRGDGSTTHVTL